MGIAVWVGMTGWRDLTSGLQLVAVACSCGLLLPPSRHFAISPCPQPQPTRSVQIARHILHLIRFCTASKWPGSRSSLAAAVLCGIVGWCLTCWAAGRLGRCTTCMQRLKSTHGVIICDLPQIASHLCVCTRRLAVGGLGASSFLSCPRFASPFLLECGRHEQRRRYCRWLCCGVRAPLSERGECGFV